MKERDFQTIFGKGNTVPGVFELKISKADKDGKLKPFPFSGLRDIQREALSKISNGTGFYYKIHDAPVSRFQKENSETMRFTPSKPFDCFYLKGIPAFVVIAYYIPRKLKVFCYIRIEAFLDEERTCGRKSLTYERAREISAHVVGV